MMHRLWIDRPFGWALPINQKKLSRPSARAQPFPSFATPDHCRWRQQRWKLWPSKYRICNVMMPQSHSRHSLKSSKINLCANISPFLSALISSFLVSAARRKSKNCCGGKTNKLWKIISQDQRTKPFRSKETEKSLRRGVAIVNLRMKLFATSYFLFFFKGSLIFVGSAGFWQKPAECYLFFDMWRKNGHDKTLKRLEWFPGSVYACPPDSLKGDALLLNR